MPRRDTRAIAAVLKADHLVRFALALISAGALAATSAQATQPIAIGSQRSRTARLAASPSSPSATAERTRRRATR
jgi:hypothetical protein